MESQFKASHPRYEVNQQLLMETIIGRFEPVKVEEVLPDHWFDTHAYKVSCLDYPSLIWMTIDERMLRPLVRSREEIKRILRLVK